MPVDQRLAALSDDLLFVAVLVYAAAMLVFALSSALASSSAPARRAAASTVGRARSVALAGRAGHDISAVGRGDVALAERPLGPDGPGPLDAGSLDSPAARRLIRIALVVTAVGWLLHAASLATRGLSVGRVPWGNMYEFSSAVSLAAVTVFLVLCARQPAVRSLGAFALLPVVLYLGLAGTVLYAPSAPLVPALDSYWLAIHVVAAIISTGAFMVSGVTALLYLARLRYDRLSASASAPRSGLGRLLPASGVLDRTTYRLIAFGFPVWTFAVVAGAIWAEGAWGRYWGWDPKETWAFISWVLYAGYLHARTTGGWRGKGAAVIAVVAFGSMLANYFGVNIFGTGLHAYSGLTDG